MAFGQNLSGFNLTEEQKKKAQDQYASGRQSSLAPVADSAVQQGKDALRMMNPFRETVTPVAPAVSSQPAPQQNTVARNLLNSPPQAQPQTRQTYPLAGGQSSISLNENAQPNSLARTAAPLSPPPAKPLKATLPGGIAYEGDLQGNRTFSMGTQGQDGYGRMSVRPGTGFAPAVNALATGAGQQTRNIGGLTVSGPQGAVERLAAPVGNVDYNSPRYQQFVAQNRAKEAYVNRDIVNPLAVNAPQSPKYMTRAEGDAAGIGWKGRLGKYKEDVDAFNKATGNLAQLDVAAMQEAGAGRRALLSAQGTNDANELARQRLMGEQGLNDARIKSEGINQQKGQMEVDQAKKMQALNDQYLAEQDPVKQKNLGNQILTMQGKNSKDWQITTREEPLDPANPMAGTTKRPYAVNLNDPNQVIELGGQGGSGQYEQAPQDAKGRKKGSVYNTPKGPLKWTGDGWTDEF